MLDLFIKKIIKDSDSVEKPSVRMQYGKLTSVVGMTMNVLLFAGKFFVGNLSGSIAIVSDSFNNLSDAATCFINLFGFFLAGKPADKGHPFGHGRIEYITGLVMSFLIILIGFEFLRTSINRIMHPAALSFSPVMMIILLGSILVKGWMFFFYRGIGKKIHSQTIIAASVDSFSDIAITTTTFLCLIISVQFHLKIDGYVGVLVSMLVLFAGYSVAKEALSPLLGRETDPEVVLKIRNILTSDSSVIGVHDIIVHDYGPGRMMASAHVEVPVCGDFMQLHDSIDTLERRVSDELRIPLTIHMDPIDMNNESTNELRRVVGGIANDISSSISIHDFRVVSGMTHSNLIFDVAVPPDFPMENDEIRSLIEGKLSDVRKEKFYLVIQFDRAYME